MFCNNIFLFEVFSLKETPSERPLKSGGEMKNRDKEYKKIFCYTIFSGWALFR